jgi:hypothetical protein
MVCTGDKTEKDVHHSVNQLFSMLEEKDLKYMISVVFHHPDSTFISSKVLEIYQKFLGDHQPFFCK